MRYGFEMNLCNLPYSVLKEILLKTNYVTFCHMNCVSRSMHSILSNERRDFQHSLTLQVLKQVNTPICQQISWMIKTHRWNSEEFNRIHSLIYSQILILKRDNSGNKHLIRSVFEACIDNEEERLRDAIRDVFIYAIHHQWGI